MTRDEHLIHRSYTRRHDSSTPPVIPVLDTWLSVVLSFLAGFQEVILVHDRQPLNSGYEMWRYRENFSQ
uniref:Uncharacterized protein n=1 Tax=Chlorobium phaeobacteroides (strain BS1) TaxID=331678 RepID=B3EPB7_CHLPB